MPGDHASPTVTLTSTKEENTMTTICEPITTTADASRLALRRTGALAGLLVGPLFLTIILVLTLVERGTLHRYGWTYMTSNDVPWPSGLSTGRYGAVQIANFAVAGILIVTFTRALAVDLRGFTGRLATLFLAIQGAALIASAAPADHSMMEGHSPNTWHGYVHDVAFFFVAIPSLLAPLFVGLALRRDSRWRPLARLSFLVPPLLIGMFAAQSAVGDLAFTGFLIVVLGWEAILARRLSRL
jgi:hypothetical protein